MARRRIQLRQENLDDNVVQDDFLPMYQNMIKELGSAPTCGRKAKVYLKAVLVFYALVLYWYAVYELLGYMVIQRVVSRLEMAGNREVTPAELEEDTVTDEETSSLHLVEGWTTLAVGQFYFLASVCVLIVWQEFTCEKRHSHEEDRVSMLEDQDNSEDAETLDPRSPQALAPVAASIPPLEELDSGNNLHASDSAQPSEQHRCFATARRGWRTPPMRVLQWNMSCFLGVVAWMGLDLTCDAVHLLVQGLRQTRARLGINFGFIIAANLIVITLHQIPADDVKAPRQRPRRGAGAARGARGARMEARAESRENGMEGGGLLAAGARGESEEEGAGTVMVGEGLPRSAGRGGGGVAGGGKELMEWVMESGVKVRKRVQEQAEQIAVGGAIAAGGARNSTAGMLAMMGEQGAVAVAAAEKEGLIAGEVSAAGVVGAKQG